MTSDVTISKNDKKNITYKKNGKSNSSSLLDCLVYMTAYFGEARSKLSISELLTETEDDKITASIFCRIAPKLGLKADIVRKKLNKVEHALCPVILQLKNGNACVVLGFKDKKIAFVVFPNDGGKNIIKEISIKELKNSATSEIILIKQANLTDKALNSSNDGVAEFSGHWFWQVIWSNKFIYLRVMIAAFFINLFVLASPIFIMNVYDRVLPNQALDTGWALAIGITGVFLFDFLLKILRSYFIDIAGRRGDVIWARRLYDHILDMKADARKEPVGAFASHMREFEHIKDFFTSVSLTAIIDFPFTILFMIIIWLMGGIVVLVPLILFFFVFLAGILLQIPVKSLVRRSFKSNEEKQATLVESLNGLETIKGCGATRHFRSTYGKYTAESAIWGQKSRWWSALSMHLAGFAQQLSSVGVILIGMYMVKAGDMSVGTLIACVILSGRAIAPVGQIAGLINRFHQATSALKILNKIMKMPTERPKERRFLHRPHLFGIYGVEDVSYTYPQAKTPTLQHITFAIQAGERVGIVGRIGSGKTTLIKLMMKFYQPSKGVIRIDGSDISQIDPIDLRRNITYIGQDSMLFRGTVRDNIAMGRPWASDEEILKAAQISGAHSFIRQHPLGYDAPVGENGHGFSGGQKQAITIARAVLGNPSMLICDEPTNEMDNMSEALLVHSLQNWLDEKNRGLVVVTHRFSLLNLVDRLILMEQGKIVADGPKDKVIAALNGEQNKANNNVKVKLSTKTNKIEKKDSPNDKKE